MPFPAAPVVLKVSPKKGLVVKPKLDAKAKPDAPQAPPLNMKACKAYLAQHGMVTSKDDAAACFSVEGWGKASCKARGG